MNKLIKIETDEKGQQLVSARELHTYLESKERFSLWFARMCEYGFEKNTDYTPYKKIHPQNKQEVIDYAIVLDMAKELSMLARNEKGKQARRYFIAVEKQVSKSVVSSPLDLIVQMATEMKKQETRQMLLENRVADIENRPSINGVLQQYTILGYCNNANIKVSLNKAALYGRKCSKICKDLGLECGTTPDPRFGRVKTYPVNVLDEVIQG